MMAKNNKKVNKKTIKKSNFDTLTNLVTGMGTGLDGRSYSQFTFSALNDWVELEASYINNWIASSIIDIPIEDALREWRSFNFNESEVLIAAEKKFNVKSLIQEAFTWAGVYGGAGVIPIIEGQELSTPLELENIAKGSLKNFIVLDRTYLSGMTFQLNNPMDPNFGLPEYYNVAGGSSQIHHSRIVRVDGIKLPMRWRSSNNGWGDSRLRKCLDDIKDAVSAKSGIANLITKANIDTITKENLIDELSDSDTSPKLTERYRLFGLMSSMFKLALLDGSEVLDRKQVAFSGLGDVLSSLMEWTSGAAKIPMTRLFGVQSKGIGDSGQGDMRNYYSNIRGAQESSYRQPLKQLDQIILMSELGKIPDDYDFEFNPLAQLTDEELATQRQIDAQTDDIRMQQGVIRRSQIAKKLREQAVYAITDDDIKQLESDENAEREGDYQFSFSNALKPNQSNQEKTGGQANSL